MRKLIWCGVMGLAVVASGYRTFRHAETRSESVADRQNLPAEGCSGGCAYAPADQGESSSDYLSGSGFSCTHTSPLCNHTPPEPCDTAADQTATTGSGQAIELHGSAGTITPVIYIATNEEPPLALPQDVAEASADAFPPAAPVVMPYCDDDDYRTVRMPYAADDPLTGSKPGTGPQFPGGFEDSEADDPAIPECREDDNVFRQYPGVPSTGGRPAGSGRKKAAPWQHEKEPFLPVLPEVEQHKAPATGKGGKNTNAPAVDWWFGGVSNVFESVPLFPATLKKHVSLKFKYGRDNENSPRQHVDTLELRPGDLRGTGTEPQPF